MGEEIKHTIVMNGNPDRSNMNHDIVATIMTPKET